MRLPLFLRRRLAGEVPVARVFWWDMLAVGTLINVATGGMALAAYVGGAPLWLAAMIFFSPLPYNLALCVSIWRSAAKAPPAAATFFKVASALWVSLMLVV
jgi:hypothetical protein